jgi:alpha-N-arabinofuranosidase
LIHLARTFRNPILPGCYPIVHLPPGDDYLVTAFGSTPGLPIFHSRDLVHWRQLGHVLDRPSQLPLDGVRPSGGLYAPTIRHTNDTFYVINTLVDGQTRSGNFVVTASDPAGPWSEPPLEDAPGFDPSLFFDDDGRVWYTGTRLAEADYYTGHTEIWLRELDLKTMRLVGEECILWDGAVKGAVWAEAPHIYKLDGDTIGALRDAHTSSDAGQRYRGPYGPTAQPDPDHRHLGLDHPIVGTGRRLCRPRLRVVAVLLAMRPLRRFWNRGRETFLSWCAGGRLADHQRRDWAGRVLVSRARPARTRLARTARPR